ncbi:hypothetical protein V6N12_045861 [Hibiscus sabdariffa]|uniref:Uncharacterized protein n=1 Tax=Hibiscus sabdariffa TaxID=183260 RepID=A0ABR2G537_9ROSI
MVAIHVSSDDIPSTEVVGHEVSVSKMKSEEDLRMEAPIIVIADVTTIAHVTATMRTTSIIPLILKPQRTFETVWGFLPHKYLIKMEVDISVPKALGTRSVSREDGGSRPSSSFRSESMLKLLGKFPKYKT